MNLWIYESTQNINFNFNYRRGRGRERECGYEYEKKGILDGYEYTDFFRINERKKMK